MEHTNCFQKNNFVIGLNEPEPRVPDKSIGKKF